jgi:hypothetical protein
MSAGFFRGASWYFFSSEAVLSAIRFIPFALLLTLLALLFIRFGLAVELDQNGSADKAGLMTMMASVQSYQQIEASGYAATILLSIVALPFFQIAQELRDRWGELARRVIENFGFLLVSAAFVFALYTLFNWYDQLASAKTKALVAVIANIAGPALILVLFAVLARFAFILLRVLLLDRSRLAAATVKFIPSRHDIAEVFEMLETARARRSYVEWVEREAAASKHAEALADIVANPWPDGRRPNRYNDATSTRLAQLDERWLKLDV